MLHIFDHSDAPDLVSLLPRHPAPSQHWHAFSSPEALVRHAETIRHSMWFDYETQNISFYGNLTFEQAATMCREGWPKGAERVGKLRDKINAVHPQGLRFVRHDVAGAYPVVARAVAGNPMCMRRMDTTRIRRKPVITLVNHVGGLSYVKADTFINKCAVVAAVVDAIEAAGYSCHVVGLSMAAKYKEATDFICGVAFTIKNPGEQVDIGRMAFALGHVAMFRRFVFAARSGQAMSRDPLGGSRDNLGATTDFPNIANDAGAYVLPSMNENESYFKEEETAATAGLAYLIQQLSLQGCPAFPQSAQAA